MILKLIRYSFLEDRTLGIITGIKDRKTPFYTLELPDRNNERNISCIPEGKYQCVRHWSTKFPYLHLLIMNVPNRDGILIHAGNYPKNTTGCILLGQSINNEGDLVNSRKAIDEFMELIKAADEIILEVTNV
jgi:hypothetical protein